MHECQQFESRATAFGGEVNGNPPESKGWISKIFSARSMRKFRMKTSRYTEAQIISILRQAEGGVPPHGECSAKPCCGTAASMMNQMKAIECGAEREPPAEANVCGLEHAVAQRGASIAVACRAFGVSETCYRYGPKLRAENQESDDLLTGRTDARKTWGCGL
jgi:hypothetical protein